MRPAPIGGIFPHVLAPLLCLMGAVALDVRLEESRGLAEADRAQLTAQIQARASLRGADGAIVVRALALPGALRVTLSRPDAAKTAQASLSGAPEAWAPAIDAALEALGWPSPSPLMPAVTTASAAAAPPLSGDAPAPAGGPSILGLSLVGGAVAAGAAGVVLGAMNAAAREEGNPLPVGPERDALDDRAAATGLGANVLFAVAGAALIAGVWVLVVD